jgi:hypothetical protein
MDERISDIRIPVGHFIKLPARFVDVEPKRMIYACGDAMGGKDKSGDLSITNIEAYSKEGFNIFVCVGDDDRNMHYLSEHPELNIMLILLSGNPRADFVRLRKAFTGVLDTIDTDDHRVFPDSQTTFHMLKKEGTAQNVFHYIVFGNQYRPADGGWGEPNFKHTKININVLQFQKKGDVFVESTKDVPHPRHTNGGSRKRRRYTSKKRIRWM